MAIPNHPSDLYLKELEKMFSFAWNNKTYRVKRNIQRMGIEDGEPQCFYGFFEIVLHTTPLVFKLRDRTPYSKVCFRLFVLVCFKSHEQFLSYLATVTITGDRPMHCTYGF
jgi:hypothetical protein